MRYIFIINHPAHVHLFRNAIIEIKKRGHPVLIVSRDKDITLSLLASYQLDSIVIGKHKSTIISWGIEFITNTYRLIRIIKEFKPDKIVSVASSIGSWSSLITGIPHYAFDDTENARLEHFFYQPFSKKIFTPCSYTRNHGKKQVRYEGYHELAYLHPNWFTPNPSILSKINIPDGQPFFVLRFVSWEATHDLGQHGVGEKREELIRLLSEHGKVIISDENSKITKTSDGIDVPFDQIHNLLYYASMYVGEGGTMATEAALLGTPSILINSITSGNWFELENKYELMYSCENFQDALEIIMKLLNQENLKSDWKKRRAIMLSQKIDVTTMIIDQICN
jgi:hypothetical protein